MQSNQTVVDSAPADKSGKAKKIVKIVLDVVLYLFLALCLFGVIVTVTAKKDPDGTANIFGYQMRFVQSASMEKCEQTDVSQFQIKDIPVKSVVFIQTVPADEKKAAEWYASLKVGDVLTFKYMYTKQETITHRIVEIVPNEEKGGYTIQLEGDNKASDAKTLKQTIETWQTDSLNYVVGKVTSASYPLGLFVYALKSPVGLVCIIIVPCLVVIGFEIMRIVSVVNADKVKKQKETEQARQDELDELKRKLAALENAAQTECAPTNIDGEPTAPDGGTAEAD